MLNDHPAAGPGVRVSQPPGQPDRGAPAARPLLTLDLRQLPQPLQPPASPVKQSATAAWLVGLVRINDIMLVGCLCGAAHWKRCYYHDYEESRESRPRLSRARAPQSTQHFSCGRVGTSRSQCGVSGGSKGPHSFPGVTEPNRLALAS